MPGKFIGLDGQMHDFDLDAAIGVVQGYSTQRPGWEATIVFDPNSRTFIELRDGPQDVRGDRESEVKQVSTEYLSNAYNLTELQVKLFLKDPRSWKFIEHEKSRAVDFSR